MNIKNIELIILKIDQIKFSESKNYKTAIKKI